jgi:ribosome-associated protein
MATKKKAKKAKPQRGGKRAGKTAKSAGRGAGGRAAAGKGAARGGRPSGPRRKAPAPKTAVRPKRSPAAAPPAPDAPDTARPTALAVAQAGLDKKAEEVTVLDVRGLAGYADYFVVMTADSDRQSGAIADHVEETMKKMGVSKVSVEGYESGRWILLDYGDVLAHVMNRESRGFYDLEGLWADAPRFRVEG